MSLLMSEDFHDMMTGALPPARFRPTTVYSITVTLADGSIHGYHRIGGTAMEHTLEAQDAYGLGCTVRVRPAAEHRG